MRRCTGHRLTARITAQVSAVAKCESTWPTTTARPISSAPPRIQLARHAGTVVGIEEVPAAVDAARMNAARAGARHARFVAGLVEDALATVTENVDVVTMNPPRKGCGPGVARAVAARRPRRILYLSCHPESFARDAAVLVDEGFGLARVRPFDLLPQTAHVEVLGVFVRDSA